MATPELPTHFPCWVKAVYSWGGETKRDLGFIEGDLIECLNAGDGMWWMGRLRRDRRMCGLFPSNFVRVLEDDFKPTPHRSSPLASQSASRSNSQNTNIPVTPKSKSIFRKPFSAHTAAPSPSIDATGISNTPSPAGSLSSKRKLRPYSSMEKPKAYTPPPATPKPEPPVSNMPAPIPRASLSRPSSTRPSIEKHQISRTSSPMPYHQHSSRQLSRQSSLVTQEHDDMNSSPPPPPPAHRVAYTRQNSPETSDLYAQQSGGQYFTARTPSPAPSDLRSAGMTPSPLRDAMNDVMTSLEGMSVQQQYEEAPEANRQPSNPWSPEAFDEMLTASYPRNDRAHTSLGIPHNSEYEDGRFCEQYQEPPELRSYVQRMESRLRHAHEQDATHAYLLDDHDDSSPPVPPPKQQFGPSRQQNFREQSHSNDYQTTSSRPSSSHVNSHGEPNRNDVQQVLRSRKSAYELGRDRLSRTFTTKSSITTASSAAQSTSTNDSNSTQLTSQSLMSGYSAGGFSATSAGSLARRKWGRTNSIKERPMSAMDLQHPGGGLSTVSYHSSHDSSQGNSTYDVNPDPGGLLGGFSSPTPKKWGFLGRMVDTVKTGAATARSNISTGSSSRPQSRQGNVFSSAMSAVSSPSRPQSSAARDMGLGGTGDWVQMRRDVNRSNSLSRNERNERMERCQMSDYPVLNPVETLDETVEGDEDMHGQCIRNPADMLACNFSMVDKSARFVNNLPALVNAASLAQGYLCRPYKSDVQRLRAIFTWVAERITWEEDYEGEIDARRVIQTKRGCSKEIAVLVAEMCSAIGVHVEIVRGHLKIPAELSLTEDLNDAAAKANHWWNAVIADGEWRILDCSLANPTNPRRALYSSAGNSVAETWWFLTRPKEICYTHVPLLPEQQHMVPPVSHDVLMALPIANPPYFKNGIQMWDFDTSLLNLEGLEMAYVQLSVPDDIECIANVTARSFSRDADGDFFESGDFTTKRALAQGDFISCDSNGGTHNSFKRYTIKAFVPATSAESLASSVSNVATLNIYAGRRGLMHSINSNPHPLALSLPLIHTSGLNPDYEFFTRHPTPHALRHELYVVGPLCKRLVMNNTFVFTVRQHPASGNWQGVEKKERSTSPNPSMRPSSALSMTCPGSAMSMASISASGSSYSNPSATGSDSSNGGPGNGTQAAQQKPAKLAMQSPSGKIMRMTRKAEQRGRGQVTDEDGIVKVGSTWETIIKIGERGTWRGLVLADRSARWCVWGEWDCL